MKKTMLFVLTAGLALLAFLLIKQLRNISVDSRDENLAAELRTELAGWFEIHKEYPPSLDDVWKQTTLHNYFEKYGVPPDRQNIFHYSSHGNWYELQYTNFGALHNEVGSNGLVLH